MALSLSVSLTLCLSLSLSLSLFLSHSLSVSLSLSLKGQGTLASHSLAGRKSVGTLIRQAMAVNALGVSMRSSSKSLWRSVLSCSSDQTLRSILLSIWIHVFHPRVPRCLVKQDDSNNFTEVEDPFYEQEGDSLGAERLTLNSSFDCTLQVETVRQDFCGERIIV